MSQEKSLHILIIDDDRDHIDLILRAFRNDPKPFRTSVAGNLKRAREITVGDPPDLIISDYNLPDGNGIDIIERVDGEVKIPLIVMTGYGDERLAVEIMKSGAVDYIVKSASTFEAMPEIARKSLRFWENLHERILAEKAEQDSGKRLADILAFLPDPVLAIDNKGTVIAWNNAMETLTGVPAADILGKGDHEYSIPFYGERRPILIDLVLEENAEIVKKYDFIQRDGDRITSEMVSALLSGGRGAYLWGTASPLYDTAGMRIGAIEVVRDITERKRTEQIIRASEEKFRTLIDDVPDFIIVHRSGILLFVSRAASAVTGYTSDELLGKSMLDYIIPEDRERVVSAMRRRMRGEQVDPYEISIQTKSGEYRTVIIRGSMIEYEGAPASLNVLTDVTGIRAGEQALQLSEERFRELFNNMSAGVAIYEASPDGKDFLIRDVNRAVETIENVRKSEILGRSILEVFPGVREFGLFDVFLRVAKSGVAESFPVSLYKDSRISGWRENFVYRLPSGEIVAIYEDVTEKKQAEEALRESEEKYRQVFERAPIGIAHFDRRGVVTDCNEHLANILGAPRETVIGTDMPVAFRDQKQKDALNKALAGDFGYFEGEYSSVTGGKTSMIRTVYAPIFDINGVVAGGISITEDISDRVRAEKAVQKASRYNRSLIEASLDPLVTIGRDGKITDVNLATESATGYSREELVGSDFFQYFTEPEKAEEGYRRAFSDGNVRDYPLEIRHRDGHTTPVLYNASVYRNDSGEVTGVFAAARDITERTKMERSLLESEQKFRTLADYTYDWEYWMLPDGTYRYVSPSCERITGYTADEFYQDPDLFGKIIHPDDREKITSHITSGLTEEDAEGSIEFRIITRSGNTVWIAHICHSISNSRGEFIGRRGSNRDVTKRRLAEESLRMSEIRFRALIQNSSDIIRILDRDGRILYESDSSERILGYPRGFLIGKVPMDYIHPDDRDRVKTDLLAVIDRNNTGTPTEFRIRKADGEYIWVDSIGTNLLDIPGVNGIVITTRPIQQRKEAEQALLESEQRLRLSLEGADAGFWDWYLPSGKAVFSDRYYTMLGYEPGEFPATYEAWINQMHPDDRKRVIPSLEQQIQKNQSQLEIEYRIRAKEGNWLWLLGRGKVVERDGEGNPLRVTGVNIDITNRRLMESEIRSLNTVLEQRVKDRTEALSRVNESLEEENMQRLDAEEKLRASLAEKTMLLKEIHHRVKNNLQIIASLLNLQSRYIRDESTLAAIRESQNRVKAMALVHEKLYRAEDISHIDLNEYLKFLGTGLFQFYDARSRGIQFRLEIPDVKVDINTAIPLGLVINELISNSLKYAFPAGRTGEVSVSVKTEGKDITVLFSDNGIGIPADLDWQNTQSLGLRLVNTLVDQLNGTITLDRSSGTRFTMILHEKV